MRLFIVCKITKKKKVSAYPYMTNNMISNTLRQVHKTNLLIKHYLLKLIFSTISELFMKEK